MLLLGLGLCLDSLVLVCLLLVFGLVSLVLVVPWFLVLVLFFFLLKMNLVFLKSVEIPAFRERQSKIQERQTISTKVKITYKPLRLQSWCSDRCV